MNSKDGTLLQLQRITKIYPNGLIANRDIDLMIKRGCVYVILGENGAGKTTLMNIIFGLISPTFGSILYKGKRIAFSSTADAIKAGIGMIHQHFKLVPVLSVLDNCFLGIEPKRFFLTDKRLMKSRLTQLLKEYEFNLPLDKPVSECSTHVRQILEIVKTLIRGAELIIMDEPTSLLAPQERAHLFNIIRSLKKSGKTIILITHKLTEALNIADTLIIMGEGKILQSFISHEENPKQHDLLELLFDNQPVHFNQIDQPCSQDEKLLEFNHINLCKNHHIQLHDLSFTLYKGEILGFAGMANSGQQEIIDIITGYEQDYTGDFRLFGMPPSHHTPLKARKAGITYIPSDRLQQGSD
ncbi:MAG TPA: ATP-binding cassette domain-containing protein, partial [Thermotogota bacterium]|nr:ATP-binding cassette domain-containing protein [Thermotogota bacterium]